jgi:hypothetical protein
MVNILNNGQKENEKYPQLWAQGQWKISSTTCLGKMKISSTMGVRKTENILNYGVRKMENILNNGQRENGKYPQLHA